MSFLDDIFARLEKYSGMPVLQEIRDGRTTGVTGRELLELVGKARAFLSGRNLNQGDRCALLAHNSVRWVAMDLAMMAEGLIVVPLYARQAPAELVVMMKDCFPALICCGDADLAKAVKQEWPDAPDHCLFDQVFGHPASVAGGSRLADHDHVAIIYTSGTSGEAKGVVLNAGNIGYMLGCTSGRLDQLVGEVGRRDRVFHYLPFCFAGSWIMLLTCLLRGNVLMLSTGLAALAADMPAANADYFLNVPQLLERMRKGVDEQVAMRGGAARVIYERAKVAWGRKRNGNSRLLDSIWLGLGSAVAFPAIRKKLVGENLLALICGSAPLNIETQLFFVMLSIPVLQVYGLTETTAICTMDDPARVEPGCVGPAIKGVEMKVGENDEIMVRGPNIFSGYWGRPQETAKVLIDGWFHSGDQGEVNAQGNWKIIGRIKNLIILGSGHNIAPEPIEEELLQAIPGAAQVVLAGNGRSYLTAIVTGNASQAAVQDAVDSINAHLPHYRQVRAFHLHREPFSVENGMLTANGKLKREVIAAHLREEIEALYRQRQAS
jgi:long-chain acyl-CoA synthetase